MTHSSPDSELLPCPFCGEADVGFGRTGQKWQTVACSECGAEGPCTEIDRELIIAKWNARAPAQAAGDGELVCTQYALTAATTAMREAHENLCVGISKIPQKPIELHNAAQILYHAIEDAPAQPQTVPQSYRDTVRRVGQAREKRLRELRDCLEWLDRKGGLGHDVHERIRSVLAGTALSRPQHTPRESGK